MGKKGKTQSTSSSKSAPPKCTCDDPYKCSCGNRPERPSKGHKWDPDKQEWGGKGHRQKGASGTAAVVASGPTITERGKTTIAQWQKLPTSILDEVCKKDKRPPPKYKAIQSQHDKYLFRVIVQDAKASRRGGEYDLIFVPASCVKNEEQAKEEAALLALLHLTPKIPHERKLPEPYKTTWLNALQTINNNNSATAHSNSDNDNTGGNSIRLKTTPSPIPIPNETDTSVATVSNLMNANKYISLGDKRKQLEERKKARNAKIRRHEAIRMANKDVQVFMSAKVRKQIETLLRGDADEELVRALLKESDDSMLDEDGGGDNDDIVMLYVIQRLVHEGFTSGQAKASYAAVLKNPSVAMKSSINGDEDAYMDKCYDECLQWLCIHLNEDQLPEGFGK
jgi:hypothetical protein